MIYLNEERPWTNRFTSILRSYKHDKFKLITVNLIIQNILTDLNTSNISDTDALQRMSRRCSSAILTYVCVP
jgi:hypothetical protein